MSRYDAATRDFTGSEARSLRGWPHAGEAAAALTAVQRVLKSAGLDLHELANRIEKSNGASISEADLQRVYEQEGPVHMRASAGHEVARDLAVMPQDKKESRQ